MWEPSDSLLTWLDIKKFGEMQIAFAIWLETSEVYKDTVFNAYL